eukprot:12892949-Prorocentrum_lima.AAC.1
MGGASSVYHCLPCPPSPSLTCSAILAPTLTPLPLLCCCCPRTSHSPRQLPRESHPCALPSCPSVPPVCATF